MTRRATDLGLLAVAAVWGSSYLATKEIASPDTVFALLGCGLRLPRPSSRSSCVAGWRVDPRRGDLRCGGRMLLAAVCIAETYGVTMTSASNAGLIMALTIVVTPMIQRHRVSRRFYLAAALAVIGCGLLTQSAGLAAPRAETSSSSSRPCCVRCM